MFQLNIEKEKYVNIDSRITQRQGVEPPNVTNDLIEPMQTNLELRKAVVQRMNGTYLHYLKKEILLRMDRKYMTDEFLKR